MILLADLLLLAALSAGPCAPADRARLAAELQDGLRRAPGVGADGVRYDERESRLYLVHGGKPRCVVNLSSLEDEYCEAPAKGRAEVLARLLAAVTTSCVDPVPPPASYEEARRQLLPVVRSRSYVEEARASLGPARPLAGEPLGEELFIALVRDLPETMAVVPADQLAAWKVTWATAYADALANLRARSAEPFQELAPGVWTGPWSDSYGASRLLLTDKLRALPKKGDAVVAIPGRDAIFVCGSEDAAALVKLARLVEQEAQQPRSVTALPLIVAGDGTIRPFAPPAAHSAHAAMRRLRLLEANRTYAEDKARLDAANKASGTDVFVASFLVTERPAGELTSIGVLTVGVHTLLPRTDVVVFVDLDQGKEPLAVAPFEEVIRVLGPRAVRRPGYPPRWEVKELPPREELAKLGRMAGF